MDFADGFMSFTTFARGSVLALLFSGCSGLNFQFQNDVFAGTDQNFTNGVNTAYSVDKEELPNFIQTGLEQLPTWTTERTEKVIFSVRQDMYTPDDLKAKEVVRDQNPYAGTLTLGIKRSVSDKTQKVGTELRLGTSGPPSLAEKTQIFVHDGLSDLGRNQTHPNGWDNQIEAEPVFNIEHTREWSDSKYAIGICELVPYNLTIFRLGTINTDAQFGRGYKFGYNVPELDRTNIKTVPGIYLFAEGFGIASYRNFYYDGGVFRDSEHTVNSTHLIGGADTGAGIEYRKYNIKFHYITKSRTYSEQKEDLHSFGFISLGVDW